VHGFNIGRSFEFRNCGDTHGAPCDTDSSAVVQLLIDAGANVNAASEEGKTPFYIACLRGMESTVMKMLECGAKASGINGKKLPLTAACLSGCVSVVQLLLTNGANPNLQEESNSDCRYLFSSLPQTSSDSKLIYPLLIAVRYGNSDMVTALLNAGADVNAVNDDGENIVCFGIKNAIKDRDYLSTEQIRKRLSTVRLLLQHGANVNVLMPDGSSALYLAVTALVEARGWPRLDYVIELLRLQVTYGADLHDSSCQLAGNVYRRPLNTLTLTTPAAGDY